jgi:hypothetical protein
MGWAVERVVENRRPGLAEQAAGGREFLSFGIAQPRELGRGDEADGGDPVEMCSMQAGVNSLPSPFAIARDRQ